MLLAALLAVATSDLRLELVRESLTGTHYRYRQYQSGLPTDDYVTTTSPLPAPRGEGPGEGLRISGGRRIRREILEEAPYKPFAHDYDATTGELLRRTPLFYNAKPARVFDPNPVVTLNNPDLHDNNDGPVPEAAYKTVELPDSAVHGPWVDLVDRQLPSIPPPEGNLVFDRTNDGFEDVNAYFHIHRNQEWVQSLGFRGPRAIAPYAVPADAHAAFGEDNSFFLPSSTQAGRGTLYFGDGGTDDAEDADIVIHEYSHALMEWIAPGTFGGGFGSEARALAEGTADYWAFSAHVDARRASGRDLYCIADWDARCWLDAASERCGYPANSNCLRRVDSTRTMATYDPSDTSGTEHRNGAIWSSALREIREQLPRAVMDSIVLESMFGAPPRPTFAVMARRLLEADRLLYQGDHAGPICNAMRARGILSDCGPALRGELTHFQARDRAVAIPDNDPAGIASTIRIDDARAIERLHVRVDIEHSARGDLRIELIAPDGTVVLLQSTSSSRTPDIHVTYGLTADPVQGLGILRGRSAAGVWTLRVYDRQPLDTGRLLSWGLDIQFVGDEPQTARPRAGRAQMIPVVGHLFGQAGTYVSDVRIANETTLPQIATLIFTRSLRNGLVEFLATRVFVGPGQTIAFDDVVSRTFHTFGSGTLEVLGDVLVTSRTYLLAPNGTYGQDVPPNLEPAFRGGPPLLVAPFAEEGARYNLGLSETAGGRGTVSVAGRIIEIEPFSHVQFPVGPELQTISVLTGDANVVAYLSQLRGSDAMLIPALQSRRRVFVAPAVTAQTSDPPQWQSDLLLASAASAPATVTLAGDGERTVNVPFRADDVLAVLFHRTVTTATMSVDVRAGTFPAARVVHGDTMQYVSFPPQGVEGTNQLLFVENSESYRTNIGVAVTSASALIEISIFNAAGAEIERHTLTAGTGIVQVPVRSRVIGGRAAVLLRTGQGHVYASLIDNRTGDATFFAGQ